MNCGAYKKAMKLITFYMFTSSFSFIPSTQCPQLSLTTCFDLFQDRYANLLWGRLACEMLLHMFDNAKEDLIKLDEYCISLEVVVVSLNEI
jgi:hypothetical protein